MDSSNTISTEITTVAMAVTVKLHETTQYDSEEHKGSEDTRRYEIGEGNNREENNREEVSKEVNKPEQFVYKTDRGYEHETPKQNNNEIYTHGEPQHEQRELEDGECGVHKLREPEYKPTSAIRPHLM
jgi:hypothetical protein